MANMGTKKFITQVHSEIGVHPSRQGNIQPKPARPNKRSRLAPSTESKPSSINPLKKRIRDLTRLLERSENLPANVRVDAEQALAAHKGELAVAQAEKQKQIMIKKYHMVRFFDRQNATRRLKKLRKRLATASGHDDESTIVRQVHNAEVDLNYTLYCPLNQKYISLYPSKKMESAEKRGEEADATGDDKPPLWKEVERSMEKGTLDTLRNGACQTDDPK
ncbi:MAG: 18S rRNA maturation protein [Candelina mexicana]|nr:MAG: 18S rRNA maturation protein [Candelina mexicana]